MNTTAIIGNALAFNLLTEDGDLLIEGVSLEDAKAMAKDWIDVVIVPVGADLEEVLPLAA